MLTAPGSGWTYYFYRGASEPILVACTLWAIDRAIAERFLQAWWFGVALGLMRPEAWPFLLLYGAWLFWQLPHLRVWVVIGLMAQPIGWFVPPWISTGQPFLAATHASEYNGHLGASRLRTVLGRGESLQSLPSLLLAGAAVVLTLWRGRDRLVFWLAGAVAAWWIVVVGMTLDGYPGLQRFYLPAAAVTCVLSGLGLMLVAFALGDLLTGRIGRRGSDSWADPRPSPLYGVVVAGATALILLGATHFVGSRWAFARKQQHLAAVAVTRIDALGTAVAVLGGRTGVLPCGSSVVTINHSLQTALAWKLGTTLERVQTVLRAPGPTGSASSSGGGLAFVGPWDSIDGGPPPIDPSLSVHKQIRTVGPWRIFEVYAPGAKPRCVGG